jgi:hypothetical protein
VSTTTSELTATRSQALHRVAEPFTAQHRPSVLRRVSWWEWVLLLAFLLVCLAVAGPRAMAQVDCRVAPVPLVFGKETTVSMSVNSGRPCAIWVRTASAVVGEFAIDMQPVHGRALARGRTGVIYRSKPQFRGQDAFGFALSGRSPQASGTSLIRVNVTVK